MADLYINARLTIPSEEISVSTARSSGPGGQNVNKVNSKVTLHWSPGDCATLRADWCRRFVASYANRINREGQIVISSQQYRDQSRNLADARQRLVSMLLSCQNPPKTRKATRPTLGSKRRRLEQKRQQSQKKQNRQRPRRDD
jgi:ribosome-associated protein